MPKLIDISAAISHPVARRLLKRIHKPTERLLAIDQINDHYERFQCTVLSGAPRKSVFTTALEVLQVRFAIDSGNLASIPENGPVVVVANHPFGAIEGVILGAMLLEVRPDVRVLGNYLLKEIVGIRDYIFAVNPFGNKKYSSLNAGGIKHCLSWLKRGGCLATFPSGEVASWHPRQGGVVDPAWHSHVAALIRASQATVVPVFFPGRNSLLFLALGLVNHRFRTLWLARELANKCRQQFSVRVGQAIPWSRLRHFPDDRAVINYLRLSTEVLKVPREGVARLNTSSPACKNTGERLQPVIPAVPRRLMKQEIERLPNHQCLLERGEFSVWYARSGQIPQLLNEIGRLREITFREVQEGTGRRLDLDRYDAYYLHLFLWNKAEGEVVGGYRMGLADEIVEERGVQGLYTHSLFQFKPEFINQLSAAIELGRSFVRPEYQKKFNSLLLIWRGIGQFVRRNHRYKVLFGPVSISRAYQAISTNLMVHFLKHHKFHAELSRYVLPRRPYRVKPISFLYKKLIKNGFCGIDDISFLISEIESDGKGVPILLKHYLKLNGKLLSFNVDKAFSNVVDGLLLVDLRETDPRVLHRFMRKSDDTRGFSAENKRTAPVAARLA